MRDEDRQDKVTVLCEILEERPKSIKIKVDKKEVWLPRSQVSQILRIPDSPAQIDVAEWLAVREGLSD